MSTIDHIATYTNLPAGHYRFRIVVFDISEPLEASEFDIAFVKAPFFYETWWFCTLCVLFLAGGAWTTYQLRLRQIRTMFSAVLSEVADVSQKGTQAYTGTEGWSVLTHPPTCPWLAEQVMEACLRNTPRSNSSV
jgi:hypothetical protein